MDKSEKKEYVSPAVVCQREIEALTGVCNTPGNTGMDKLSFDPMQGICMNVVT